MLVLNSELWWQLLLLHGGARKLLIVIIFSIVGIGLKFNTTYLKRLAPIVRFSARDLPLRFCDRNVFVNLVPSHVIQQGLILLQQRCHLVLRSQFHINRGMNHAVQVVYYSEGLAFLNEVSATISNLL